MNGGLFVVKGGTTDIELQRARKPYRCSHMAPHGTALPGDCTARIEPGDTYARTRQSWMDWDPVAVTCLVAAGWLTATDR